MTLIHSFKRRAVLRIAGLLFVISLIVYLCLSYRASLYTTVPSGPLWSSSLPAYSNQWNYTAPTSLRQPNPNFKAAFVTLTKGDRAALSSLRQTIRDLEDNFNKDYGYPYIIFSSDVLTDEFKELASSITHGDVVFYELGPEMYGYHNETDRAKAAQARIDMGEREIMFGDSEDYRFASRFMAGLIFRHPALEDIDYYWRFEPGTEYVCPIMFDPFQFMFDHDKMISFSMALYEYEETIPSLFNTVMEFAGQHPDIIKPKTGPNTLWHFIIDAETGGFNRCHFWSNFQIADLNFFRGKEYQAYFDFIDKSGGIFYERWGDPVIQTLGAVLFLEKQQVQFWQNIGYRVANYFTHCPPSLSIYSKCSCQPSQNFDFDGYSCLRFF